MDGFDNATWQALGLVVTLLGLGASVLVWSRKGAISGARAVAWSLLPLAAGLTGVLRLGWDIADSVGRWAARLVFSPVVWLGLVVAMVSLLLFVVTGFAQRRVKPQGATAPPPVATRRDKKLTSKASAPPAKAPKPGAGSGAGDDMADIEEILRKHGIT